VVAIRDGKTSSERVRRVRAEQPTLVGEETPTESADENNGAEVPEEQVTYHEYVVLDAAGRLQVPREYLEELGITDRAEVELTEAGILVKPALGLAGAAAQAARVSQVAETWGPQRGSKDWKLRLSDASRGLRGLLRRGNK